DVNGLVKFDGLVDGAIHPVTLARLERPHDGLYELPAPFIKSATAKAGSVTQVLFILPHRPKLRVVLRPIGFVDLPAAQVVLSRIMGKDHRNGRTTVRLEEVEAKDHVDGKVDFAHQAVHAYRVSVKIAAGPDRSYGATVVDFVLSAKDDKTVEIEIHRFFTRVRFIGLCMATVPRQVWIRGNELVKAYESAKLQGSVIVPDIGDVTAYADHLQDYWASTTQDRMWKGRYNGPRSDAEDVRERVALLGRMIDKAAAGLDDDTELKVFVAPECFFLGRYGAYTHEVFGTLIKRLQELVADPKWRAWVFVFGTVNGVYTLDGDKLQMFNISPVIRGGWQGTDPGKSTRLMQKTFFSAEILARDDLVPAAERDRDQIVEESVGAAFQATQNEGLIADAIERIVADIDSLGIEAKTRLNDWNPGRWAKVKALVVRETLAKGRTAFVRNIRELAVDDTRRAAGLPENYPADLRFLLTFYLDAPTVRSIATPRGNSFDARDFSISCMRFPGPWLDDVVSGEPIDLRHTKLTFALETCADHNVGRASTALAGFATHERPDIHVVPSAGMVLNPARICLVDSGFAFNCDGWNAPGFGYAASRRAAHFVIEQDERLPRKSGANPLMPHTELAQRSGAANVFVTDPITTMAVGEDCSHIFGYRTAVERQQYADDMVRLSESVHDDMERDTRAAADATGHAITAKAQEIVVLDGQLVAKRAELALLAPSAPPGGPPGPPVPGAPRPVDPRAGLTRDITALERRKTTAEAALRDLQATKTAQDDQADQLAARVRPAGPNAPEPLRAGEIHIYPSKALPTRYA
ncbi:MAG: hypothetical protein IAG13_15355, partial [Deltaproteobacteria bacterium]|nr:hypothetical protein [Nannocystaceae bacterium]